MNKQKQMETLRTQVLTCPPCPNARQRIQVVPAEGNVDAEIVLVGQGPGAVEEETGRPFVGPAGALLDKVLVEAGLEREELWISNLIKCRAVKQEKGRVVDRIPSAAEVRACRPWLEEELKTIQPKVVVCIGTPAAQALIDKKLKMGEDHGQFREGFLGLQCIATFHPSYVLRLRSIDPEAHTRIWRALVDDLKKARDAVK